MVLACIIAADAPSIIILARNATGSAAPVVVSVDRAIDLISHGSNNFPPCQYLVYLCIYRQLVSARVCLKLFESKQQLQEVTRVVRFR
jgi:hypothetical protein